MAYLTEAFPYVFSYRASRQFQYRTSVVKAVSGKAERNAIWSYPLHVYQVPLANRLQTEMEGLFEFWHAAGGREHTFGLRDPFEYSTTTLGSAVAATDQPLGTATAGQDEFQLRKAYTRGGQTRYRKITRPVAADLLVAINGTPTAAYTLGAGGVITLNTPATGGEVVTWGGTFLVPVAFDDDVMEQLIHEYSGGEYVGDAVLRLAEDRE